MNRGSDTVISVYSDARAEYTKQLCVFLVPAYFQFFTDLLDKSKQMMINEPKRALWQFQTYLNEIHDWNMEKVNNEIHTIYTNCGCDYLEDLLTAVFIAHTKVLTAIRLSSNNKKVEINIPKVEHFLFKVLCETAKLLWSSTYLFRDGIPGIEKQQNYRTIEQLINEGILQAVRSLVPVKSILKDFINNDGGDHDDSDDESNKRPKENITQEVPQTINEPITLPETPLTEEVSSNKVETIPAPDEPVKSAEVEHYEPLSVTSSIHQEIVKNKEASIQDTTDAPVPTIIIDDKPRVKFGEFNAVFDSDNPSESELVYDSSEESVPDLEILDETGVPLTAGLDFDNINEKEETTQELSSADYEELV
jgi:hypothetical protein